MNQINIIEMKMENNPAVANITTREILIDSRLREYPKLRKIILAHELGHMMKDKTMNDYLWRDMRDYPYLYLRKDYWEFIKKNKIEIYKKRTFIDNFKMAYYNLMIIIFVAPMTTVVVLTALIIKRFK